MTSKRKDYTRHDPDVLANFKRTARLSGLTPEGVLGVFLQKHLDAIYSYIKAGHAESEPIQGRLDDAANYLLLLGALIEESCENPS